MLARILVVLPFTLWLLVVAVSFGGYLLPALFVFVIFGLPGFALFGPLNPIRQPVQAALRITVGLAASFFLVLVTGFVSDQFNAVWVICGICATVPLILRFRVGAVFCARTIGESPKFAWWSAFSATVLAVIPLTGVGTIGDLEPAYRPFFNADFFKHLAIAQSISVGDYFPPVDPFGAHGGQLRYYWLQHVLPATGLQLFPNLDPVRLLLAVGGLQTALFAILLFGLAERVGCGAKIAFFAALSGLLGLSFDGLAALLAQPTLGWLETASSVNVENGDLSVLFGAGSFLAATTLFRLGLYIPQHQLAAVFFLSWLLLADEGGGRALFGRMAVLVVIPATSILLGVPAVGALAVVALLIRRDSSLCHLAAVAAGLLLPVFAGMLEIQHAGQLILRTETGGLEPELVWRLAWLPIQLFTSLGFPFALAVISIVSRKTSQFERRLIVTPVAVVVAGYVCAEALVSQGSMRVNVELKLSLLLGVLLVPAVANWLKLMRRGEVIPAHLVWVIPAGLLGLLTPLHDIWWHSSMAATSDSSRATTVIPADDMRALRWIRETLQKDSIVLQYPEPPFLAGGRDAWIPVLAGRRIVVSPRATNMDVRQLRSARELFEPDSGRLASDAARGLGADYIYLSRSLGPRESERVFERWESDPGLLIVFQSGDVSIWRVLTVAAS